MFTKKTHWENVYQQKSPLEVSWFQKEPTLSLALIHDSQIASDEPIIDVGGGASVLVDRLYKEGFTKLAVLDISENALANSKKRLADSAGEIEWFEADITEFDVPHPFSLWHDRAVFHFLTEQADRKKYVSVLNRALKPGGHLLIAAFAIGGPEKCSGLNVVQYDSQKLVTELGSDFELVEERSEIHLTPSNQEQKFTYFRFKKKQWDNKT